LNSVGDVNLNKNNRGFHGRRQRAQFLFFQMEESVRAGKFELVDAQERSRAILVVDKTSDEPSLTFYNKSGKPRLTLGLESSGASKVQLHDEEGVPLAALAVEKKGNATVHLLSKKDDSRVILSMEVDEGPTFSLQGRTGMSSVLLSARPNASPHLSFFDKSGGLLWGAP
jgi:hypothetical protein